MVTEDRLVDTLIGMLDIKLFENPKDKLGISQIKKLQQLSRLSLVHVNSGSFFQTLIQLPSQHNHMSLTPIHVPSLSELPKTVHIHTLAMKHPHLPLFTKQYQHHITMKFKKNIFVSEEKNSSDQPGPESSIHKMVEPITVVPSPKFKKAILTKSISKKKKAPKIKKKKKKRKKKTTKKKKKN